jgi:hypothetical protein
MTDSLLSGLLDSILHIICLGEKSNYGNGTLHNGESRLFSEHRLENLIPICLRLGQESQAIANIRRARYRFLASKIAIPPLAYHAGTSMRRKKSNGENIPF